MDVIFQSSTKSLFLLPFGIYFGFFCVGIWIFITADGEIYSSWIKNIFFSKYYFSRLFSVTIIIFALYQFIDTLLVLRYPPIQINTTLQRKEICVDSKSHSHLVKFTQTPTFPISHDVYQQLNIGECYRVTYYRDENDQTNQYLQEISKANVCQ